LRAFEAGYRIQPHKDVSIDLATFHNRYKDLITVVGQKDLVYTPQMLLFNNVFENVFAANTYGAELTTGWSAKENLRFSGSYARLNITTIAGSHVFPRPLENPRGRAPLNQGTFRASYTPKSGHRLDIDLYCVGRLSAAGVPAYQRLDVHWDWQLTQHLTVSVLGRDLLRPRHYEFQSEGFATKSPVRRGASVRVRWDF
jgi:iron complex outermembrane receptor protein